MGMKIMGIIKGLIFVIVYFSSLSIIYMTEYNTPALLCILCVSLYLMMHLGHVKKQLKNKVQLNKKLQKKLINHNNYFAEVLVHDIKVPTIAQLRAIELLKHETVGAINPEQKELINQLEHSCKYTLDMLSMVLATYKLELEQHNFNFKQTNLTDILLESFAETSHLAQAKNVSFAYMATQKNALADVDETQIKKVIINMIETALMYSESGTKILVNIFTKENSLKFSIITRGRALNNEECRTMFADYTLDNPKYTAVGHDIGLYLSRKIIEAHNGHIYVSSDGIITNTFSFVIPQYRETAILETVCPVLVHNCP